MGATAEVHVGTRHAGTPTVGAIADVDVGAATVASMAVAHRAITIPGVVPTFRSAACLITTPRR
jgi:hypothetical protein